MVVIGGDGNYVFFWDSGIRNGIIFNFGVGDYCVIVIDDSGC